MQISAIKPYTTSETYQKIYRQNKLKDTTVQEKPAANSTVNLADIHYNQLLVKPANEQISFKGIEKVGSVITSAIKSIPFEERLASLVEIIDGNDIIVAAKNTL